MGDCLGRANLNRVVLHAARFAALAALAITVSGCAQNQAQRVASGGGIDPKYGVTASPRLVAEGEEVPAGGGRYHVGKPYVIAGKTYYPSERATPVVGTASWYGADFHGRKTANGEIFNRASVSAASPTMPLPSYARVTNLRNSSSIIVRVNDRGPYHGGRVMDVSQKVAEALDFRHHGTTKVKVEYIGRAQLAGSDDIKLLASLRTDGNPASLDGRADPSAYNGRLTRAFACNRCAHGFDHCCLEQRRGRGGCSPGAERIVAAGIGTVAAFASV